MLKDPTQFRERFKRWKAGELVYDKGLPKFEDGKNNTLRLPILPLFNFNLR